MAIPKQDIINGLPIRWAFHMWATRTLPADTRWSFPDWREYLLSWKQDGIGLLFEYMQETNFENETRPMLQDFGADTLAGFIKFWIKCCVDYEKLLNKHYTRLFRIRK